jgi:hypothetical protein
MYMHNIRGTNNRDDIPSCKWPPCSCRNVIGPLCCTTLLYVILLAQLRRLCWMVSCARCPAAADLQAGYAVSRGPAAQPAQRTAQHSHDEAILVENQQARQPADQMRC